MPFRNEHSARLMDPKAEHIRVGRTKGSGDGKVQGKTVPTSISVIWYIQKKQGKEVPVAQALRFPIKRWTAESAKSWLSKNKIKYLLFEKAEPKENDSENSAPCYTYYIDKAKKQLDIILHDEIGFFGTQSKQFHELLAENGGVQTITVDINSPGGSVWDGFSIYNALKAHSAEVRIKVSGVAASIASVIAMAGNVIEMPETSMLMMHKPFIGAMFGADSPKLRKQAEALDKIEQGIIAAYKTRLDKSKKEIAEMLNETTWLTAKEAHELGMADLVTEEEDVLDFFDFTSYEYGEIPEAVMNKYDIERDDDLEIQDIDDPTNEKNNLEKLIDLITKLLNSKKESDIMADEKLEKKVADQEKEIADLKASNKSLTEKNDLLTTTIQNQSAAMETKELDSRKTEYKNFCEKLVEQGKIKPADVDTHVDTMELKFQADKAKQKDGSKETPSLDSYKKLLSELPESIPVGDRHVADKKKAADTQKVDAKDPLDVAARKLMKDNKNLSYSDAVAQAYEEDPSLYDSANQIGEEIKK